MYYNYEELDAYAYDESKGREKTLKEVAEIEENYSADRGTMIKVTEANIIQHYVDINFGDERW